MKTDDMLTPEELQALRSALLKASTCTNRVSYYVPHGHSNWGRDEYREHLVPCGLTGPYGTVADCGEHPSPTEQAHKDNVHELGLAELAWAKVHRRHAKTYG